MVSMAQLVFSSFLSSNSLCLFFLSVFFFAFLAILITSSFLFNLNTISTESDAIFHTFQ